MTVVPSRPIRLVLAVSIAALALFASQAGLRPTVARATSCQTASGGGDAGATAVYVNPTFTVTGPINASSCEMGVIYDDKYAGVTPPRINGATIFGAADGDGVFLKRVNPAKTVSISNSLITNNAFGVFSHEAGATLFNVKVSANTGFGLFVESNTTTTFSVTSSYVLNNGNTGVDANDINLTIMNSTISGNGLDGINAGCIDSPAGCPSQSQPLNLTGDNVTGNGRYGLYTGNTGKPGEFGINAVSSNFSLNGQDGIFLNGSANVLLRGSKLTSNKTAGAYLVDSPGFEPFLRMDQSQAMYNPIGIDIEDTMPGLSPAAVSLANYSRACSNAIVDVETVANPANWSADTTSKVCSNRMG
jgi:hypothetical protein